MVTLLSTNDEFTEAFLVGLSDEMGRELLWRQYPTDCPRHLLPPVLGPNHDELPAAHPPVRRHRPRQPRLDRPAGAVGSRRRRDPRRGRASLPRPDVMAMPRTGPGAERAAAAARDTRPASPTRPPRCSTPCFRPTSCSPGLDITVDELRKPRLVDRRRRASAGHPVPPLRAATWPATRCASPRPGAAHGAAVAAARLENPTRIAFEAGDFLPAGELRTPCPRTPHEVRDARRTVARLTTERDNAAPRGGAQPGAATRRHRRDRRQDRRSARTASSSSWTRVTPAPTCPWCCCPCGSRPDSPRTGDHDVLQGAHLPRRGPRRRRWSAASPPTRSSPGRSCWTAVWAEPRAGGGLGRAGARRRRRSGRVGRPRHHAEQPGRAVDRRPFRSSPRPPSVRPATWWPGRCPTGSWWWPSRPAGARPSTGSPIPRDLRCPR